MINLFVSLSRKILVIIISKVYARWVVPRLLKEGEIVQRVADSQAFLHINLASTDYHAAIDVIDFTPAGCF